MYELRRPTLSYYGPGTTSGGGGIPVSDFFQSQWNTQQRLKALESSSWNVAANSPTSTWGPTGQRWVPNTPGWNEIVPNMIECDPTWAAVQATLNSITDAQANAGTTVLVRPGDLGGSGNGSTATPAVQNVGSTAWTKRVLVRPRDGYGTVTVSGVRMFRAHGIVWSGFIQGGWRIDSCINAGMARINASGSLDWSITDGEPDMTGLYVCEVVRPNSYLTTSDVAQEFTTGSSIINPVFVGCYLAPNWRPQGSSAHQDSLQFEPFYGKIITTRGYTNGMLFQDCVVFGSKNCGLQINAINDATLDHCYIINQGAYPTRYPAPSGADLGGGNALNGGKSALPRLKLRNSTIIGGWTISSSTGLNSDTVSEVTNVITEFDRSSSYPGTYHVYPGINDDNFESMTGLTRPGTPDKDYLLSSIWAN